MKNFAIVRFPTKTFSSETVYGKIIYRGVEEFTDRIGEELRTSFLQSGVECSCVERSFKPAGSVFQAGDGTGQFYICVSVERTAMPGAEVIVRAQPRKGAVRNWNEFEPFLIRAVECAAPGCSPMWLTEDEFVEKLPNA